MKFHMHNPTPDDRTRCGQETHHAMIIAFEYGSPKVTCKSCLRFHNLDRAEEMEASA